VKVVRVCRAVAVADALLSKSYQIAGRFSRKRLFFCSYWRISAADKARVQADLSDGLRRVVADAPKPRF